MPVPEAMTWLPRPVYTQRCCADSLACTLLHQAQLRRCHAGALKVQSGCRGCHRHSGKQIHCGPCAQVHQQQGMLPHSLFHTSVSRSATPCLGPATGHPHSVFPVRSVDARWRIQRVRFECVYCDSFQGNYSSSQQQIPCRLREHPPSACSSARPCPVTTLHI